MKPIKVTIECEMPKINKIIEINDRKDYAKAKYSLQSAMSLWRRLKELAGEENEIPK